VSNPVIAAIIKKNDLEVVGWNIRSYDTMISLTISGYLMAFFPIRKKTAFARCSAKISSIFRVVSGLGPSSNPRTTQPFFALFFAIRSFNSLKAQ
jgi:hypothetical protein